MKTSIRTASDPEFDADTITATLPNGEEMMVYVFTDRNGVPFVQIDTTGDFGRVRVFLNDGPVWDGDPDTDALPGAHLREVSRRGVDMVITDDEQIARNRLVDAIAKRVNA